MPEAAASAHPLDDDAIGKALMRIAATDPDERWRRRPLPGGVCRWRVA